MKVTIDGHIIETSNIIEIQYRPNSLSFTIVLLGNHHIEISRDRDYYISDLMLLVPESIREAYSSVCYIPERHRTPEHVAIINNINNTVNNIRDNLRLEAAAVITKIYESLMRAWDPYSLPIQDLSIKFDPFFHHRKDNIVVHPITSSDDEEEEEEDESEWDDDDDDELHTDY